MRSHNGSIDTTHNPPPLSFYNTFMDPDPGVQLIMDSPDPVLQHRLVVSGTKCSFLY